VKGIAGHSQGVIPALVLSSSSTYVDFARRSCVALQYMFWHGARAQQVFPVVSLPAKLLREAGADAPTPMLSVRGLALEVLLKHVAQINNTQNNVVPSLPGLGASAVQSSSLAINKVHVALVNGEAPTNVVVSGHPVLLHKLRTLLLALQADPNQSQSRIPYSKRKPDFAMSFLPVSVPFHCPILAPAVELIAQDALRLGLTFSAKDLLVPVFATDDVFNLQDFQGIVFFRIVPTRCRLGVCIRV